MSFITKRDRVFNGYDILDLPARNEGKLKAYSSCTDARAWSHFCSDKSDHLVEIIKRNNETCRPKYIPTDVIVNTLMGAKNTEINRLRRKIEEFEQMLAVYDQLELTSDQKSEIANAHAAIKAANKELDDMCLDLDLSSFTEGIDSEAFETGKSRGDEITRPKDFEMETSRRTEWSFDKLSNRNKENKSNQAGGLSCPCDASTVAYDPRIEEMQETIIGKDSKLNAMRNTIAVMENDICEPYCIYAHIYTALEKIFGTLCQNEKYKEYLELLTSGKDIRHVDIKGKIFYKLKVFEKFCSALISPCSTDCSCYHAEIVSRVETAFVFTEENFKITEENLKTNVDSERAHLVADIMENDEMKEILIKKKSSVVGENTSTDEDVPYNNNSSIDIQNLDRLKNLQTSYKDLLICYDELKYDKDSLSLKCRKYDELEKEFENLRSQLNSYDSLWNEKEYYKNRSDDLDLLKEKYVVLADETLNLETQLQTQTEICAATFETVKQLRCENTALRKKLNEVLPAFEKEKHGLICKLKESECKIMCQAQQIESLSAQINKFLERNNENESNERDTEALVDQIEYQKKEIKNHRETLLYNDKEKERLQNEFQEKLLIIDDLRIEVDNWKGICEKTIQRNDTLEKITEESQNDLKKLIEENKTLVENVETKTIVIENLLKVVSQKSLDIKELADVVEYKKQENSTLLKQLHEINFEFNTKIQMLEGEKNEVLSSLKLASQESELFLAETCNFYTENQEPTMKINNEPTGNPGEYDKTDKNVTELSLDSQSNKSSILVNEIEKIRAVNTEHINILLSQSKESAKNLEKKEKESEILENKLQQINVLKEKFNKLKEAHKKILEEKNNCDIKLQQKTNKLDEANNQIKVFREEYERLVTVIEEKQKVMEDLRKVKYQNELILEEKNNLENDLLLKNHETQNLSLMINRYKMEKQNFTLISERVRILEQRILKLQKEYDNLIKDNDDVLLQVEMQRDELNYLHNTIKEKRDENINLTIEIKTLQEQQLITQNKVDSLECEKLRFTTNLNGMKTENNLLKEKMLSQTVLENDLSELKMSYIKIKTEKENVECNLQLQTTQLNNIELKNKELQEINANLIAYNSDMENTLINTRNELQLQVTSPNFYEDLKKEVEEIKDKNDFNLTRIQNLLDKIHESDQIIGNLSKDIFDRDCKISILENQVNELGDEVKRLQTNLSATIDLGEEISISNREYDQSLKQMEAHHSKATHNMQIELVKLMNQNGQLEKQLSFTKVDIEESIEKKDVHLHDEKEIIVTDIKQLEIRCVGDSALSPDNCCVKSISKSLERIGNYIDTRNISCQLILKKADEAKKIVEKEKLKIIKEKEEAIIEKINIQKQLTVLKEKLEQQMSNDKVVINDLEAELLNQKLIIDKINQSAQNYVLKLEEELHSIEDLYKNALGKISDLDNKLQNASAESQQNNDIIEKVKSELEEKCQDIKSLEKILNTIKNKNTNDFSAQTIYQNNITSTFSQTENIELQETPANNYLNVDLTTKFENVNGCKNDTLLNINTDDLKEYTSDKKQNHLLTNMHPPKANDIQILTANVEPSLGFVKNAYLHYKIKRLSIRGMEKYSISCIRDEDVFDSEGQLLTVSDKFSTTFSNTYLPSEISIAKVQFSDSKSNNVNDKNRGPIAPIAIINEDVDNSLYADSSKNGNNSMTSANLTMIDNKDFIIIYRDSDCDKESRINSETINEKENLTKAKYMQINKEGINSLNFPVKEQTLEDVTAESIPYGYEDLEQKSQFASSYENKDIFLISYDISAQHSLSESSLLRNFVKKDMKVNTAQQKNGKKISKLTDDRNSRSFISLISSMGGIKLRQEDVKENDHEIISSVISNKKTDINLREHYNNTLYNDRKTFSNTISDGLSLNMEEEQAIWKNSGKIKKTHRNFGLNTKNESDPENIDAFKKFEYLRKSHSNEMFNRSYIFSNNSSLLKHPSFLMSLSKGCKTNDVGIMVQNDDVNYIEKIKYLTVTLESIDRDYKEKIRAIKAQYDNNLKYIKNEHNQGVQSLQSLHEETLQDILKVHENETDNLRSMSIDAMRKVDKLEKENRILKDKILMSNPTKLSEEPSKISTAESKKGSSKYKSRLDNKTLTKTMVEEFNIKPKVKTHGPCTCSLDINISDTIRNLFEQVDVDQRRMAEQAYLKDIASKILTGSIEALDVQELSFLNFKIRSTWKSILRKEEVLHKRIDSLETELVNKQRQTQKHMAELDRKVAEERRRLQEVREAVCRDSPLGGPADSLQLPRLELNAAEKDITRNFNATYNICEKLPAGDLPPPLSCTELRYRRANRENNRVKLDGDERREKKAYCDERPTRLRRTDRPNLRSHKK